MALTSENLGEMVSPAVQTNNILSDVELKEADRNHKYLEIKMIGIFTWHGLWRVISEVVILLVLTEKI